jgi:hypothetical protein
MNTMKTYHRPIKSYHGGCLRCYSQDINGLEVCRGCQYYDTDWSKPDLSIDISGARVDDSEDNQLTKKIMTDKELKSSIMNYFGLPNISEIIPSEDLGSYSYQLFLKFASLEELEGNYVLNITLKKIEDYESQKTFNTKTS